MLPNPEGPLSHHIPSSLASANKEVKQLVDASSKKDSGKYAVYTEEEKLKKAKRAAEMGVTNTIQHFQKKLVERPLKESTVRTWMNSY